jgi:hypothetical protein
MSPISVTIRRGIIAAITTTFFATCSSHLCAQNTFPGSGNAGAGTNSPTAPLTIQGSASDPSLTNDTALANIKSSSTVELTFGGQVNSPYSFWMQTKRSPNDGYSYPLALNPLGGNVGIGTTSPYGKLSIVSSSFEALGVGYQGTNSNRLLFGAEFNATIGAEANVGFIGYGPVAGGGYPRSISVGAYSGSAWNEILRLQSGGNVGVGTNSPLHAFSVTGNTGFQGNFWYATNPGINIGDNVSHTVLGTKRMQLYVNTTGSYGSIQALSQGVSNLPLVLNETGGNVGVGTTTPDASLSIKATHNVWRIGDVYNVAGGNVYAGLSDAAPDASSYFLLSRVGMGGGDRYVNAPAGGSLDLQIGAASAITIASNRYVGIGTTQAPTQKLEVNGNINVIGTGNITLAGSINAKYQDFAEWVPSSEQFAAGTVVVLDQTKSNQVTSSTVSYDTRVAGVVSEQPGIALGEKSEGKVLVATTGRVRVKVDATKSPIHIGDLLATSDVPGVAMKSEPVNLGGVQIHRPGTLIGKALEPLEKGKGEILVLLSLQ